MSAAHSTSSAILIEDSWQDTVPLHRTDAPWPATLAGMPLSPVPLTSREDRFARAFPGQIAKFRSHESEVILRRVASATRRERVPTRPVSIITTWGTAAAACRYSVCPLKGMPPSLITPLCTGAVTIAANSPERQPVSARSSSAVT